MPPDQHDGDSGLHRVLDAEIDRTISDYKGTASSGDPLSGNDFALDRGAVDRYSPSVRSSTRGIFTVHRSMLATTFAVVVLLATADCAPYPAPREVGAQPTTPIGASTSAAAGAATTAATSPKPAAKPSPVVTHIEYTGYDPARDPKADIDAALRQAAKNHQEVLLDFGADWCPDCKSLDAMFNSTAINTLLGTDYVVVPIDVGQFDHNLDLASNYINLQTSGIPALVVLTSSGKARANTDDGSFSNARSMSPSQVTAFLKRWAQVSKA